MTQQDRNKRPAQQESSECALPRLLEMCLRNNVAQIRPLLSKCDFNRDTEEGWTPIIYAAKEGHEELVKLLLDDAGVDPNPLRPQTHTALRGAALGGHLPCVKALVDRGADVNAPSGGLRTPLMGAAMIGHMEMCTYLLAHGADRAAVNSFGEVAADVARMKGFPEIEALLRPPR